MDLSYPAEANFEFLGEVNRSVQSDFTDISTAGTFLNWQR